jgi:hypothetical protein
MYAEEQEQKLQSEEEVKANQVKGLQEQHEKARKIQEEIDRNRQEQEQLIAEKVSEAA